VFLFIYFQSLTLTIVQLHQLHDIQSNLSYVTKGTVKYGHIRQVVI